jgi:hypothetical protein
LFRKESTLAVHNCQKKRRIKEQDERGVQLGFQAYLRFFEMTQGSAKNKTNADFIESPYYNAFVAFGRFMYNIQAINPKAYTEWVIRENKKLDYWTKDSYYEEYLFTYIRKENVQDALERGLGIMQTWADNHNSSFQHYFLYASPNVICRDIANGRISPWVIFNCDSGKKFLETLNDEQVEIIFKWIDPDFWLKKFKDYTADTLWVQDILKQAGL